MIFEEYYEDIFEPVVSLGVNSRHKRDQKAVFSHKCHCKHHRLLCCAEEALKVFKENFRQSKDKCRNKILEKAGRRVEYDPLDCEKMKIFRRGLVCIDECSGQESGYLDDYGNPIDAVFESRVKKIFAEESWFASVQDKVISTCLTEARNATADRDAPDSETCNPAGIRLQRCLFREVQLNCPADLIKDENACSMLRDILQKRNDGHRLPPFKHRSD